MAARVLPIPCSLSLGGAPRSAGLLDEPSLPVRTLAELRGDLAGLPPGGRWMLRGGEPTMRPDLLTVIRTVKAAGPNQLWMRTDGLALVSGPVCASLKRAGLSGVRIPLHSGRADAHDWLVGQPGAAKRVSRAIRAAAAAKLRVEVEITMTRSTTPYLEETAALALRLGASGLWLRRIRPRGPAAAQFITVSPRLGMLRGPVEAAVRTAVERGASVWVEGVPRCVVPGATGHLCGDGADTAPCHQACPGPPDCAGVPIEYTERFGWAELWRLTPRDTREVVRVVVPQQESTRSVRTRMLRAAQLLPRRLRLVDVAAHPEAFSLMRDALRLSVPSVEVSGRIDQLARLSDTQLFRLRTLARIDAAALDPSEVAALRVQLQRLKHGTPVGVYGIARSASEVDAFTAAGADAVRLLPGGDLAALRGPLATPHRPPCLGGPGAAPVPAEPGWKGQIHTEAPTDRLGRYRACARAARCSDGMHCPGLAAGWEAAGIGAIP